MTPSAQVELNLALTLLVLFAAVGMASFFALKQAGSPRFERVERQGSSPLSSTTLMRWVYWSAQPLATLLIRWKASANLISWAALALALLASSFLARGFFATAAWLVLCSSFMDLLDGRVARITATAGNAGEVLDASVDRYSEFSLFGSLALYYHASTWALALVLLALLGSFMVSYSTAKAESLQIQISPTRLSNLMRRPERAGYFILGSLLSTFSIHFIESSDGFAFFDSRVHGAPMLAALTLIAFASNLAAVVRLNLIYRAAKFPSAPRRGTTASTQKTTPEQSRETPADEHTIPVIPFRRRKNSHPRHSR